jgi:proline dehydrogenase
MSQPNSTTIPDFTNTQIAFAHQTDAELSKSALLFRMMNKGWLVKFSNPIALWSVENRIPMADWAVRNTIFPQFCGGTSLLDSQKCIELLAKNKVLTVLDYGAEAKESEADFNATMNENLRAIDFAARENGTVPVVVSKISGIARVGLLEKMQTAPNLTREELSEYRNVLKRIDTICHLAEKRGIAIFIDAEESWVQTAIDHLTWLMMRRYNKQKVVVYNTYQMYRHDRLQFLFDSFDAAKKEKFKLGVKLVRGAYMVKEAKRAAETGQPTPIQPSKAASDDAYNMALRFCVENCAHLAVCNASHNAESALLQVELMDKMGIARNDERFMFSQLLGMSNNLTFNLADAGFRVAKYVVYGQVRDVIPYLLRRAQENTSVTGDAGRELKLISEEMARRKL